MIEIIPAIMPKSLDDLRGKLLLVVPYVSHVQLDIMDGKFVPPKTWPYGGGRNSADTIDNSFKKILAEEEGLPMWDQVDFEIDLMVKEPERVVGDWITAGATRLIVHVESTKRLEEIVRQFNEWFAYGEIGEEGEDFGADESSDESTSDSRGEKNNDSGRDVELGLALDIETDIDTILPHLEDIDFVQFMGISPIGYQGEEFDERVLDKIRAFHNAHPEVVISVDGGVSLETAPALLEAGATRLISGSTLFESENIGATIQEFKNL